MKNTIDNFLVVVVIGLVLLGDGFMIRGILNLLFEGAFGLVGIIFSLIGLFILIAILVGFAVVFFSALIELIAPGTKFRKKR